MASATAEALAFASEGNARNTYQNFLEFRRIQRLGGFGWLHDSKGARRKFGPG
jgi:hypothetical protein